MSEWSDIAIPILNCVHEWERTSAPGQVIDDAAIAERTGQPNHHPAFRRCLSRLVRDAYLNGQDVGVKRRGVYHIRGLTALGMRELDEWPQLTPVTDVAAKRRIRAAVMHKLYDVAKGDTDSAAELHDIGDELGITRHEAEDAGRYLEDEGLIVFHSQHGQGGLVGLTHSGLVEVESGRVHPDRPTEHFPSAQIINVNAPVTYSQIGQAQGDLRQAPIYTGPRGDDLIVLIRSIRDAMDTVEVDAAERHLIENNLQTLETTAHRPDTTGQRIGSQALRSLRSILEGTVASGVGDNVMEPVPIT